MPTVRLVEEADLAAVCAIVNHYIRHTTVNFRDAEQSVAEWTAQWAAHHERYPWLVAVADTGPGDAGDVVGVAYASPYNPRAGYAWTVETTVYLAPDRVGAGVGGRLYRELLDLLTAQGYYNALAGIGLPNAASVALHERCGFSQSGVVVDAGFTMGQWLDVGHWQRVLRPVDGHPDPVRSVASVCDHGNG